MRNYSNASPAETQGLGPRKTLFVMVTVVGCIAILWPKVFYPMLFGVATKPSAIKDHRGSACCDVVLDRDSFMNATMAEIGPQKYRKRLNLLTGELSLRQERPPHLKSDGIHPAMRERGRAIPTTPTVPIIERSKSSPPPRIVEGRPGPIPGMRPPMGAGSMHQPQPKGGSMGFIMPLYTVGIVAFFIYTIMKILFKKPVPNAPYGASKSDPNFRKEVFGRDSSYIKRPEESCGPKIVVTAIQGLIDAADEHLKLRENSTNLSKEDSENLPQNGNISNGHAKTVDSSEPDFEPGKPKHPSDHMKKESTNLIESERREEAERRDERIATVLGMEMTASCEGGVRWSRPPTPVFIPHPEHSTNDDIENPEPQSIYLEGALPHESQILVADSEIRTENVVDKELNGTPEEPAVVLSSKMTLSLINLSSSEESDDKPKESSSDREESPLDEDMEIINGIDKEDKISEE